MAKYINSFDGDRLEQEATAKLGVAAPLSVFGVVGGSAGVLRYRADRAASVKSVHACAVPYKVFSLREGKSGKAVRPFAVPAVEAWGFQH